MSKDYSEWELQPSDNPQDQTELFAPQLQAPQVEEKRGLGRGVLWGAIVLLVLLIVAAATLLYLVVSGRGGQWLGSGTTGEAAPKRTVTATATATETVKVKSRDETEGETTSTATSEPPISGDCEASAFPDPRGDLSITACDGLWAVGGPANTGAVFAYQWKDGSWQQVEADSNYTTGSGGPCFSDEFIEERGMTSTAFGRLACNPDKRTD